MKEQEAQLLLSYLGNNTPFSEIWLFGDVIVLSTNEWKCKQIYVDQWYAGSPCFVFYFDPRFVESVFEPYTKTSEKEKLDRDWW